MACEQRAAEWDAKDLSLSYAGNEMGGEVGEAIAAAQDVLIEDEAG
jgi:hypothetical protein